MSVPTALGSSGDSNFEKPLSPSDLWTSKKILSWSVDHLSKNGSLSPRLDAELLLSFSLGITRIQLYCDMDKPLHISERDRFKALLRRRALGEPIAYILGYKEFFGLKFEVNSAVLIPRPDSELILQLAQEEFPADAHLNVVDMGAGSGCLALSLASCFEHAKCEGWDISSAALEVARRNADILGLSSRATFSESDLALQHTWGSFPKFDLCVANLPYIGESERATLARDVLNFEPSLALFSGDDGLCLIRQVISGLPKLLDVRKPSLSLFEIGASQGEAVKKLFEEAAFWDRIEVRQDLSGNDRVVWAKRSEH